MAIEDPDRKGYLLKYDYQLLLDDWKDRGGCRCFLGNAPCSSCTHEGHPISLEENDEAWEINKEEEEMSRVDIKEKEKDSPSFKVGKWYKCVEVDDCCQLSIGKYYRIKSIDTSECPLFLDNGAGVYTKRLDVNSECGSDLSVIVENPAWAKLPQYHIGDAVKHQDLTGKLTVGVIQQTNLNTTKEESIMSNRKVVNVKLIDQDKGLDVSLSLVHDFGEVITEDDDATTIQQLIVDNDIANLIDLHNAKRLEQVDLEILQRTGNTVLLRTKKLKDLEWLIK